MINIYNVFVFFLAEIKLFLIVLLCQFIIAKNKRLFTGTAIDRVKISLTLMSIGRTFNADLHTRPLERSIIVLCILCSWKKFRLLTGLNVKDNSYD